MSKDLVKLLAIDVKEASCIWDNGCDKWRGRVFTN
jgi:hypothetical protein